MKKFLFTFLFIASSIFSVASQEKETIDLTIEVTITKHHKGDILLALYNSEEDYMKKTYKSGKVNVKNGKATLKFKGIEKGDYAFSLFHDVNSNEKLDKNFFGIPKEPYAFSNNEKGSFGPPKYKKAMFTVQEDKHVTVSIK
ncbi:MAG: DUF2141 domain-containing protein [Flavobacteriaceae bacterium]